MICPDCQGRGFHRRRFLWIFRWRRRCRTCAGTGDYPPPRRVVVRSRSIARWRDDDRDTWPAITTREPADSIPHDTDDTFEVGSGGRSGGGGASASWGDANADEAPVIVDPFAGEAPASLAVADSVDTAAEASDASARDDSTTDESGSSGDTGTSY